MLIQSQQFIIYCDRKYTAREFRCARVLFLENTLSFFGERILFLENAAFSFFENQIYGLNIIVTIFIRTLSKSKTRLTP